MKKVRVIIIIFVLLFLSNIPPLNFVFRLFNSDSLVPGMSESLYTTKNLKYVYQGNLSDTLSNSCYRQYIALYPLSSRTLYRIQPIEPWKFWRWKDYMYDEKWRQPYNRISDKELKQALLFFAKAYNSPNGTLSCNQFDASF